MSLPRYSEYKPSGVEWLGEVPCGWAVRPLKHLARLQTGMTPPTDDLGNYTEDEVFHWIRPEDINETGAPTKASKFLAEQGWSQTRQIKAGSSLICCIGTIGKVGMTNDAVSTNQQITAAVPREGSRYLFYAISSARTELELASTGNVLRILNTERLGNISFPNPPLVEQTQIAAFLDCETGKIDNLITEQRRLVELLAEKRQAVISHAVTKGLNPNTPMKDSGIEWLGDVPAHWTMVKIKHLVAKFEQGWSPQCEGFPVESEQEWGVLKVGCVNGGTFKPEENKTLPSNLEPIPALGILTNDLLISRANTRELVGSAAIAMREYKNLLLCDKLYRLRFLNGVCSPMFIALYLGTNGARGQIELAATGASSSMVNIAQSTILDMNVALPTLKEQEAIVLYLDQQSVRFDTLTAEANHAIELLQERRSALISAAVTGKIDVRETT